jgi:acyl-CoA reductase-like NAD-dependent aldehyde dehydrogenase
VAELGLATLVGLAVGLALAWIVAAARARRLRRLGDQITRDIEPLLRRRAAEVGLECERPIWTRRHAAAEKVAFSADLARKLLDEARGQDPAHSNTALAQTVPAVDSQAVTAPRTSPQQHDED